MKSFALLRTNVSLTTNYKIMVTSNYGLYLDSIDSKPELNIKQLKRIKFNKDNTFDYILPNFWSKTSFQDAFYVQDFDDVDVMYQEFSNQYDNLYQCGGRNIGNNKDYSEEFEYFAPLHVSKNYLPTHFIIFRVDGPGLIKLTKNQFRSEILNKLKCVKVFDLTRSTDLGLFLDKSIDNNNDFPNHVSEISFDQLYSNINGIKYPLKGANPGYVENSFFWDLRKELSFYDLQYALTDKFKSEKVIYPHILNLSFLFDDTPATPTSLRKWSINRYVGFYFDNLELVQIVSPTQLFGLKNDVYIDKQNYIVSSSGGSPFTDETNLDPENLFLTINKKIYRIKQYTELFKYETQKTNLNSNTYNDQTVRKEVKKYKVLSDIPLYTYSINTNSLLNQIVVKYENGENLIVLKNGEPFTLDDYDDVDMWLMKIDQDYFKLTKNSNGYIVINSDHAFNQTETLFEYYINDPVPEYRKSYKIVLKELKEPLKLYIYKCKFTDIKDFDNDFIDTQFANFEYELDDELTATEESKLYVNNRKNESVDDFKFGSDVVNIPSSSEYTANDETFRLHRINKNDFNLTKLWSKNPNFVKWGYEKSLCANDYPYLLNNSLLADPFNRSTNFIDPVPKRVEKNLDYFLTINSDSSDYIHHSLHVEDQIKGTINKNFKFELDKYLGLSYSLDYFSYFFGKRNEFNNGKIIKNSEKWSYFLSDKYESNSTVFKGLKFRLHSVVDAQEPTKIQISNTREFDDYKFSILLSENTHAVRPDDDDPNLGRVDKKINTLRWNIIDNWKNGKFYAAKSIVLWNDVLFKSKNDVTTILPKTPWTDTDNWEYFVDVDTIYWRPDLGNTTNNLSSISGFPPIVYNYGQYHFYDSNGNADFWKPSVYYFPKEFVLYQGEMYQVREERISHGQVGSLINTLIGKTPDNNEFWSKVEGNIKPQDKVEAYLRKSWKPITEWKRSKRYNEFATTPFIAVTFGGVLYGTTERIIDNDLSPKDDPRWIRIHSFTSDTKTNYGPGAHQNNVVKINEQLYLCLDNTLPPISPTDDFIVDNSFDDGIAIYINKKHKNVLVNIYYNDHTLTKSKLNFAEWEFYDDIISNINRDKLYDYLLYQLTANNLFTSLLAPHINNGFFDKVKYIIINEDSTINIYDFNDDASFKNLPYILYPQWSTPTLIRIGQINTQPIDIDQNILKPNLILEDGLVTTKSKLNVYSDLPLATVINYTDPLLSPSPKTEFQKDVSIFRHSGFYSPIFKKIELFKANTIDKNYENYKFDTDLTDFGMTSEMVISKVNREGSQLKLKNSKKTKSIYPMIDEIGYHVVKRFIFKSSWDFEYYFECVPSIIMNNTGKEIGNNQASSVISDEKIITIRKIK